MIRTLQIFEHQRLKEADIAVYLKSIKPYLSDAEATHRSKGILRHFEQYYDKEIDKKKDAVEIFKLIKDGVQFNHYVGVVRVGNITIEVLPKMDGAKETEDKMLWQGLLYKMVKQAIHLDGKLTGYANLNYHSNNFITMYISRFVHEVAYLNRMGLVKKYRRKEGNVTALKGRLNFSKQINKNSVHAERFYVNYTTYDKDNFLNRILYKALLACRRLNNNPDLAGKIETELLQFPEMSHVPISHATFNRIVYDRKTAGYKNAIALARFILLQLHPALKSGSTDTIAVMFDMNRLYEKYIEVKLRKKLGDEYEVKAQKSEAFWKLGTDRMARKIKPDLIVSKGGDLVSILDTKWKVPKTQQFPSMDDLRQMFVYNQYPFELHNSKKRGCLVYPNHNGKILIGQFQGAGGFGNCDIVYLPVKLEGNSLDVDIDVLAEYIKECAG